MSLKFGSFWNIYSFQSKRWKSDNSKWWNFQYLILFFTLKIFEGFSISSTLECLLMPKWLIKLWFFQKISRVTLKLLTFWTLNEIKDSAFGKVKREDWLGRKSEQASQLCSSTETGVVQGWAVVNSWCQLCSFNQSINDYIIMKSSRLTRKTLPNRVLPKADILHWITQDRGLN